MKYVGASHGSRGVGSGDRRFNDRAVAGDVNGLGLPSAILVTSPGRREGKRSLLGTAAEGETFSITLPGNSGSASPLGDCECVELMIEVVTRRGCAPAARMPATARHH